MGGVYSIGIWIHEIQDIQNIHIHKHTSYMALHTIYPYPYHIQYTHMQMLLLNGKKRQESGHIPVHLPLFSIIHYPSSVIHYLPLPLRLIPATTKTDTDRPRLHHMHHIIAQSMHSLIYCQCTTNTKTHLPSLTSPHACTLPKIENRKKDK